MIARVYQAINAVSAALAQGGVAKARLNTRDNYLYRSIDDVLQRLAPLLAEYRLCILPRVLEREASDRLDESGNLLVAVSLRVAFDLVSAEDGSCHTIEAYGEALDRGDKATSKAMQSAYKYAVLQAFCVPSQGEDADASSYRLKPAPLPAEPKGGWEQWSSELTATLQACGTKDSIQALQSEHRASLAALAREQPELYSALGRVITQRKLALGARTSPGNAARHRQASAAKTVLAIDTEQATRADRPVKGTAARRKEARRSASASNANGSGAHDPHTAAAAG